MPKTYYPPTNEGRALWWENVLTDDAQAALTNLGFTAAQLAAIKADATMAVYLYRTAPQVFDTFAQSLNGWAHIYLDSPDDTTAPIQPVPPVLPAAPTAVKAGIEERRSKWVAQAKSATDYDAAVQGVTLKTEMGADSFDEATYQAVVYDAATTASATVSVKFRKANGRVDAMSFRGRKAGTAGWSELGKFMATPASLHIPLTVAGQPEEWEIQGQAYVKDSPVGLPSQIVTVLVRG